ncbi:MAG: 4-hydroxy-tetrahydrodipicolinate reductase [Myxococcales bacterium]|nr:4-hydroxy-tetrahydrodipicolinate reductase [Myxococcales bacterium]
MNAAPTPDPASAPLAPLRLAIVGPHGRMGAALCGLAGIASRWSIAARVVAPWEPVGLEGGHRGVRLDEVDGSQVDVLVDFSHREAVSLHAPWCARQGIGFVVGTTGLTDSDQAAIDAAAGQTAVFQASNFALGVALLGDLVARAAGVLGIDADVEIVETHHAHKRDAPSGTGLTLAHAVATARGQDLSAVRRGGRSGLVGVRPVGEIGLHAVRLSDVVGEHDVHFGWPDERLQLRHEAKDRRVFAAGALRAAAWLQCQRKAGQRGRFGMKDLLADALAGQGRWPT